MKKILSYLGFVKNLYFWLGIFQVALGVACGICAYFLFFSDNPLFLRIVGCLILSVGSLGIIFGEGIPHVARAIKANNMMRDGTL